MYKKKVYQHDGHFERCFLCRREVPFGPHRYEGRNIGDWQIFVCDTCYDANWDWFVPGTYPHLKKHLDTGAFPYQVNEKGCIVRP